MCSLGNTTNGASFDTSTSGNLRPTFVGGKYTNNTQRNISLNGVRDAFLGCGLLSEAGGTAGIDISATCLCVVLDGIKLRSAVGITVGAGATDLTIRAITHDASTDTKLNFTGWHRVGGMTAYAGQMFLGTGTPEAAVVAPIGSMARRIDGGAGTTLYIKESGTGNTGWVAK